MKISYNWLKTYFNTLPTPERLAEMLTGCGLEVEGLHTYCPVRGGLEGVVIGQVQTCVPHPNSDHLSLTTVDIGSGTPLHIVCGAKNVAAGQKVAVATIGTTLYFNDKELQLQKTKIRGEVSEGMICAEDELGIGTSHEGIMVLDPDAIPGTPAKSFFGIEEDVVFEIGLTPNRADAASHIGVARDLAALLTLENFRNGEQEIISFRLPDTEGFVVDNHDLDIGIEVVDPQACPRYTGMTITGITVRPSPDWLQNRLNAIGLRPINNIVDITNFVLHEIGQPLHAFDAEEISGGKVVVQKLKRGTRFVTLDGTDRELTDQDLMICNAKEPMCIAGVFGGLHSGVSEKTTAVFLESACFNPRSVRKTSKHHALQTDASFRFERGTDPGITVYALKRAALLIKELAGGTISSEIIDRYPEPAQKPAIDLSFKRMNRLIGKEIDPVSIRIILTMLGMEILSETETGMEVAAPLYKVDVTREADVVEEIIRIFGYNNIGFSPEIRSPLSIGRKPDPNRLQNVVAEYLCSIGFTEIMNNSLTRSAYYEENQDFPASGSVKILNPLSRDLDVLRQTLLFGGMESVVYNLNRKRSDLKLFEFGTTYQGKYKEVQRLAIFCTGRQLTENWNAGDDNVDLYGLKSIVQAICSRTGLPLAGFRLEPVSSSLIRNGISWKIGDEQVAILGQISGSVLKQFDCRQEVLYADLNWTSFLAAAPVKEVLFRELPKFPEVRRDLALLIRREISYADIEKVAFDCERKILKKVGLFDVYEGEKIEAGKRSYALSFILQDENKTLTEKEIDNVMKNLIRDFNVKLGAVIR